MSGSDAMHAGTLKWIHETWPVEEQVLYADWASRIHGRPLSLADALRVQGNATTWHAGWSNAKGFYQQLALHEGRTR